MQPQPAIYNRKAKSTSKHKIPNEPHQGHVKYVTAEYQTKRTLRNSYTDFHPEGISHHNTLTIPRRLRGILRLLNLANHQVKCLGHVIIESGTGLCETAVELLG